MTIFCCFFYFVFFYTFDVVLFIAGMEEIGERWVWGHIVLLLGSRRAFFRSASF